VTPRLPSSPASSDARWLKAGAPTGGIPEIPSDGACRAELPYRGRRPRQQAAYREEHKAEIAAKQAAYREEHKAEIAAKQAAYYEEHKAEIAAKQAAYYEEHKAEIAAKKAAYYEEHKAEIAAKQAAYYEEHLSCNVCGERLRRPSDDGLCGFCGEELAA